MRIPDLEDMIVDEMFQVGLCKNCGMSKELHVKVFDNPPWGHVLSCLHKFSDRPERYEST